MQKNNDSNIAVPGNKPIIRLSKNKRILKRGIIILIISFFVFLISFNVYNKHQKRVLYQKIVTSAYDTDVDFNFYVEKFYRDIGVYGIFPKKPNKIIIKFAKFDYIDNATHYHGISYGKDDDDRIEIYVNPSTWEKFNKPMRYFLMYHELAHDVLNLDDLEDTPINKGKLMYPAIASYESKTMDDFIESSHTLFKEVASKQKK
jgi:preprotein translocase subunit SecG